MLDLQEQTTKSISSIFSKYLIENKIDDDGDIAIEGLVRMYVRVLPEKSILRFISFIHSGALSAIREDQISKFANFVNSGGYTVKYSIMSNDSIICEYGLVMSGMADENFIIKTLKHFEKEVLNTKNMASKYELIKKIINKDD